jgi:hypothetical protein
MAAWDTPQAFPSFFSDPKRAMAASMRGFVLIRE